MYQKFQNLLNLHNISAYKVSKDTGILQPPVHLFFYSFLQAFQGFVTPTLLPIKFNVATIAKWHKK